MDNDLKGKLIIINMSEIIHEILKKLWLIIIAGVLVAAIGVMYANTKTSSGVPMYRATTKMYMAGEGALMGQAIIPNYMEIVKSKPVLENVITKLGLNMSYNELESCISNTIPSETSMLWITVVFPDPEWAKRVADELVIASASYALEIMGCAPPVVYEEATVSARVNNTVYVSVVQYGVIGFLVGALGVLCLVLVLYFLKDKFDTPSKVEDRLRTKLLAFTAKNKKGKEQPNGERLCRQLLNSMYLNEVNEKLISFVSVSDAEGRTELVSTVADGLVELGKNVLLLDIASDAPKTESADYETQNLYNYFEGKCGLDEIVVTNEITADRVYGGSNAGVACELYAKPQFEELLEKLRNQYDYVFVNIPALENHMEAEVIAKKVGVAVIVLSSKKTSVRKAKKSVRNLEKKSVNIVGAVLKDVKVQKNRYFKRTYRMFIEG